jgi:hypothetical protein
MPPVLFSFGYFREGLAFCAGPQSSYFRLPAVARITGRCYHAQPFLLRWGSHRFFFSGLASNLDDPEVSSQVPKITGMNHQHLAIFFLFICIFNVWVISPPSPT